MRIISVELKNFCQHADRLVEFSPGLNAIVGANGAGKSNILGGIGFCLTGSMSTSGVKADNIRQQAAKTAKSYAKLVFQHGDMTVTVQRNLRPKTPNAVMTINGGEEIVGEAAVDAEIVRLLGVPQDVISSMVVVGHGELFGFLQQTQGARLEQFQKLFRLEQAAQLYDGIGKYLNAMTIPVITESVAELQIQLQQEQAELHALEVRLAQPEMSITATQAAIRESEECLRLAETVQQLRLALQELHKAESTIRTARQQSQILHDNQSVTYSNMKAEYDAADVPAATAAISGWDAYQSAMQAVAQSKKRTEDAEAYRHTLMTAMPTADANLLVDKEKLPELRDTLKRMSESMTSLRVTAALRDGADCPTCGAAAADLQERRAAAETSLRRIQPDYDAVVGRIAYSDKYYSDMQAWEHQLMRAEQACRDAIEAERCIPAVVPVQSCDAARAVVSKSAELTKSMGELSRAMQASAAVIASADGRLSQLSEQIAGTTTTLTGLRQDAPEVIEAVREDLQNWNNVLQSLRACELRLATLRERVSSTTQRIARLEDATKRVEVTTRLRALLTSVRGVFHKEAAPALVIQANLHRLQSEINRQLTLFDADYRVQVAAGASFTAMFEGGIVQPVQRLSYGQQVALAFAFRLALNRTIIPQVNGLCLDEPTAYLDRRRIDAFAPVFEQLRQSAQATGLQCIIVTHERLLSHLFDHVIEV